MEKNGNSVPEIDGLKLLKGMISGIYPPPPMASTIPMGIVMAEPGKIVFTARAGKQHLNPLGGVHGGFAATVLDSVTGCAIHTMLDSGVGYATVDLNIKMLRPVPIDTELTATGKVINISTSIGVSEGVLEDSSGKIYAHATATCMILRAANHNDYGKESHKQD